MGGLCRQAIINIVSQMNVSLSRFDCELWMSGALGVRGSTEA